MDRFVWTSGLLEINETLVIQQRGVRIYDGEEKVGPPRAARLGLALPAPGAQSGWPLGPPRRRPRPRGAAPRLGRRPGSQRARTVAAPLRPPPAILLRVAHPAWTERGTAVRVRGAIAAAPTLGGLSI